MAASPQPDSSTTEAGEATEYASEQGRLQEMKSYLRGLAEAHDLPRTLVEHLSGEESETTPKTADALFKDFASRLSKECRAKDESLQSAQAKLDMSTSAQATLEREKSALEEAVKTKDAQLEAAESERGENEISMQKLRFALEEAEHSNRQGTPPVDVEHLTATISDLRGELMSLKSDKAELERQYEMMTAAQKHKDDERAADMQRQDEDLLKLQDENEKSKKLIQALQHEKEELRRRAAAAEAAQEPDTFRVDSKVVPRETYGKLLDNARGDAEKLEERLQQAEEERDKAVEDVDRMWQMVMDEFVPLYGRAVEEVAEHLFNVWAAEDARLMNMVGKGDYRRYPHAVVEPEPQASQASSEGPVARGETAAGLGLDGSQTSGSASPPVRLNLESELGFTRDSSQTSEDIMTGQGSAELAKALEESQTRRKEAETRVEELEGETKKQQGELEALRDEIQKLNEAAMEAAEASRDTSARLQATLDECQRQRDEANQKLKQLEGETKKQKDEIDALQGEIRKLKEAADT
ncbi:hypothetical protein LX36DRAFT_588048, partial [Colletotrichum falcatum]